MSWLQKLEEAFAFFALIMGQLAGLNATPVGGTATVSFPDDAHTLEVSESGEHWVCVSQTWKRVK